MGFKAISTSRSAATTAVSKQATVINNGTNFAVTGATITANSSISINTNTPGQAPNTQAAGLSISSINYLYANGEISTANAVSTSGGNIKINGAGFTSPMTVVVGGTTVANANITVANTTSIIASLGSASPGNVSIYTFNSAGTGAQLANGVFYSGVPVWTTSSVSFQNGAAANVQLVASSDSTLTYTLQAGSSLPTGINLISTGYLSGTATGYSTNTSSTAVIVATDNENQATQQTITWTVNVADPQFNYVTLLLNGDTGNNISNGATNNTFLDSSTNNFSITRNGSATQGTFSPYSQTGWSTYFSNSSYLQYPNLTAYSPRTGNFTLECWVFNTTAAGSNMWYVSHISGGVSLYRDTAGKLAFAKDAVAVIATSTNTIPVNAWVHLAVARSGTSLKLFINGAQEASVTDSTDIVSTGNFDIGVTASVTGPMIGYISNVRLVTGSALYTSAFTPSTTPLTAVSGTQFLGCQSNRFLDNSTNNAAVTLGSTPLIQAYSPFAPANSYASATNGGSMYCVDTSAFTSVSMGATQAFGTGDFTVECWVYNTATSHNICMAATSTTTWELLTYGSQLYWHENGGNLGGGGYGTILLNAWSHFAVSRASGTLKMFINGVQVYSAANTYNYSNNSTVRYIGPDAGGTAGQYISDFRVINGTALYTSAFTPPSAPLTAVANTALLMSCTNGGIVDAHSSNDTETVGNTQLSTGVTKFGTASIAFDGTGDYLKFASGPNQNFAMGSGDWTIEMWMYPTSAGTTQLFFDVYDGNSSGRLTLQLNTSRTIGLYGASGASRTVSTGTVTLNTWQHIAFCKASGSTRIFINGTQVNTTYSDSVTYTCTTGPIYLAANGTNGGNNFFGYIDDLRITKGFARYTANFTAPTSAFQGQ